MKPQHDLPLPTTPALELRSPAEPVELYRLIELVAALGDESIVLGPLDRQDLQGALCELLERRSHHTVVAGEVLLTKAGKEKLAAAAGVSASEESR